MTSRTGWSSPKLCNGSLSKVMQQASPGTPGHQEIVNFKEYIGYHLNQQTGEKISTTWGKIHYAKDGVHIVPTLPRK